MAGPLAVEPWLSSPGAEPRAGSRPGRARSGAPVQPGVGLDLPGYAPATAVGTSDRQSERRGSRHIHGGLSSPLLPRLVGNPRQLRGDLGTPYHGEPQRVASRDRSPQGVWCAPTIVLLSLAPRIMLWQ